MTEAGPQIASGTASDEEWFYAVLHRVGICIESGDVLGRMRAINDAKKERPDLRTWFIGIEFALPYVDSAASARDTAIAIVARFKAANNVTVNVTGDLNASDGAVVGVAHPRGPSA